MKISIRTVFDSLNCGSYLQAYALSSYLSSAGHEVVFRKRNFEGRLFLKKLFLKRIIGRLARFNATAALSQIETIKNFKDAQGVFSCVDDDSDCDAVVLGSDTIWQIENSYFANHFNEYWGCDVAANTRLISYAPSVANSPIELFEEKRGLKKALNRIDSISVRDGYSARVLEPYANKKISVVCDPTLLIDPALFPERVPGLMPENYIFVYYFGPLSKEARDILSSRCSYGKNRVVCYFDDNLVAKDIYAPKSKHPAEFIWLMKNADYVITNTFHGTVFSLLFEKQCAIDCAGKKKIQELLMSLNVAEDPTADVVVRVKDEDYGRISEALVSYRQQSLQYLQEALSVD